jgi:hypothetical protein
MTSSLLGTNLNYLSQCTIANGVNFSGKFLTQIFVCVDQTKSRKYLNDTQNLFSCCILLLQKCCYSWTRCSFLIDLFQIQLDNIKQFLIVCIHWNMKVTGINWTWRISLTSISCHGIFLFTKKLSKPGPAGYWVRILESDQKVQGSEMKSP